MASIEKSYVGTSFGQLHVRSIGAAGAETSAPLLCLHPAPSSGLYFTTVMPLLNRGRRVIAPDYPGYGGSDALAGPPAIADYAAAMLELLETMEITGRADIFGFHTGCLVGAEMTIRDPQRIHRLVLCDVPYFDAGQRRALHDKMAQPMAISADLQSLDVPWRFDISSRIDAVPLPRAFELFTEHMRAGNKDHFAFSAAFRYDCETRFAMLDADVVLLATQSGLHEATMHAASGISSATLIDVPEITTAVFEKGAAAIAKRIDQALLA